MNQIEELKQQGLSICGIATATGFDRKTVRKYLARPEQEPRYGPRPKRPSQLDAFRAYIDQRLAAGVWNAVVLLRELRAEGYGGCYSTVKEYLQPKREEARSAAVRRFETAPGRQAQVDWGHLGSWEMNGERRKLWGFTFTLGYSRMMMAEAALDQKLGTLLRMHEQAFEQLGGVPEEIVYDRMRTVWTGMDERGEIVWHPMFLDFVRYWGFTARLCAAYRAQTKGKVESGVKYVRRNFLCGLLGNTPSSLEDLNGQMKAWVWTVANQRIHGTTHEQPVTRWELERKRLRSMANRPPYPYADDELRRVARDAYVAWQGSRYSVPWQYAGKEVWVHERAGPIEVDYGAERIAVHERAGRYRVVTHSEHHRGIPLSPHRRSDKILIHLREAAPVGRITIACGLRKPGRRRCGMTTVERLQGTLTTLGLKAIEARLEGLLEQASKKEPGYADFLDELLSCEVDARRTRYLRARLQLARLPFLKTFDQFEFGFQPSIDERQIRDLRTLRFIHEASNVIFLGPPGVGKTHLSVALAEAAIQAGFGAYFMTAHDLVHDLGRAYREGRLDRRMRIYLAPKVLIIDEMGYLPLDDLGATIFFQLVSARYERGSIILTSNKSYGDWGSIFGDTIIATAILDRLLHHSTTINIRGESYRLKDRRRAGLLPRPEDQQPGTEPVMQTAVALNSRRKRDRSL